MDFLKRVWVDKCLFRIDVKEKKNWMCRRSLEYARRGDLQTAPTPHKVQCLVVSGAARKLAFEKQRVDV